MLVDIHAGRCAIHNRSIGTRAMGRVRIIFAAEGCVGRAARALGVVALACLALPGPAPATAKVLPAPVDRALDRAIAAGDPASVGLLAGGNPGLGAEIVAIAVTRRPDLAARIAAAAAGAAPQIAPQLAGAAAVANPLAAAEIAAAVWVAVPASRAAVADAVVGVLPPSDRMAAAAKVHAALDAVQLPSLEDPQ